LADPANTTGSGTNSLHAAEPLWGNYYFLSLEISHTL